VILATAPLLLAALILDAIFGEPEPIWSRVPHPAVVMGRLVDRLDQGLNQGTARRAKGALAIALLGGGAIGLGLLIAALPLGWLWSILLAAILLAQQSLSQHVQAVADAMRASTEDGRKAVSMIVGRDTTQMQPPDIARAAIESAAENMSDGVVAPAFWFLIGGLPGILFYKIVNTADSMIGHRTARHEAFGWAAARLDDVLNWGPARLTAAFLALTHPSRRVWPIVLRDAGQHRSPNAGWPESAMAAILGVALSGPRRYGGTLTQQPYLHPEGHKSPGAPEIETAIGALWKVWACLLAATAILTLL